MEKFVIEGGVPLAGTMVPAGNKNGALPILASALLTEDEVIVRNVPRIRDVDAMLSILVAIGVSVDWRGPNEVSLCAAGVHEGAGVQEVEIEPELAHDPLGHPELPLAPVDDDQVGAVGEAARPSLRQHHLGQREVRAGRRLALHAGLQSRARREEPARA